MNWIEANGASLRYDLSGNGRETVVLPHEVGGCIESWDDAVPAFQREFRVLRYDQRGFGMSEKTRVMTVVRAAGRRGAGVPSAEARL